MNSLLIIRKIDNLILNDLLPDIVDEVRDELSEEYNVVNFWSDNFRYRGLCNKASEKIITKIKDELFNIIDNIDINNIIDVDNFDINDIIDTSIEAIHGEQRHTFSLPSKWWACEHTWVHLRLLELDYYIDATCHQFQNIYDDIPEYYIGRTPPKWFLPDKENWLWKRPWKNINHKFHINHKDQYGVHRMDIFDYFVYVIWGRISDKIGNVK